MRNPDLSERAKAIKRAPKRKLSRRERAKIHSVPPTQRTKAIRKALLSKPAKKKDDSDIVKVSCQSLRIFVGGIIDVARKALDDKDMGIVEDMVDLTWNELTALGCEVEASKMRDSYQQYF